jgi:tripartite-type tricarboxylate transporter receptor subunit TctC
MNTKPLSLRLLLGLLAVAMSTLPARSQTPAVAAAYPARPITVVLGLAAGGGPDTALRQIAARLSERLGQPVVVENRPGATGTIAASAVARAAPDGHTLLFGVAGNLSIAPATLSRNPPYDPVKAFAPVIEVASGPYLWLVKADLPPRTMAEFVAWGKQRPGQANYASPGQGSAHHLATELMAQAVGIQMQHVPFTAIYPPLLGGQVDAMFDTLPGPLPHLKSARIRALGVTGPRRLAALPEVPTFAEQGLPDIDVAFYWGFVAPAGTPDAVVRRLNTEIAGILAEPGAKDLFRQWGIEASGGTPAAFGQRIAGDYARWRAFLAASSLKLD